MKEPFDINIRSIIASREIGVGFETMERFFSCLNVFSIANNCYHRHTQGSIKEAYHIAAGESMLKASILIPNAQIKNVLSIMEPGKPEDIPPLME